MGLIPQSVIDEVLARTNIRHTVEEYVTLKKSGSNFKAKCPFHDDSTPSFFVHPGKGIYKCFGCGQGGNVISFLMEIEGWTFPETVEHLAEQHGIEIPEESQEDEQKRQRRKRARQRYFQIMELSRDFFREKLWSDEGRAARFYLEERGVDEETAKEFDLGYAPDGWQNLLDHLEKKGISGKLVEKAGLALPRDSEGFYDRFRHRVMFPVVDIRGNTLGFGGRILAEDDDAPKYINSPETRFYTKGEELFGLHAAKDGIRKNDFALLVEGNFDVVVLHANGLDMTVAPLGTAVTEKQARLLGRFTDQVIVAFDGDSAGAKASVRSMEPLEKAGLNAEVIRFDETEDPDGFVRSQGPAALENKIDEAESLVKWILSRILDPAIGKSSEQKLSALKEAAKIVSKLEDPFLRNRYTREVARKLNIGDADLMEKYLKAPRRHQNQVEQKLEQQNREKALSKPERGLIMVLLEHPEWTEDFLDEDLDNLLQSRQVAELIRRIDEQIDQEGGLDLPVLMNQFSDIQFCNAVERIAVEKDLGELPEDNVRWYRECVKRLKYNWAERMERQKDRQLEQVDIQEDRDKYKEIYQEKREIAQFKTQIYEEET